jgi:NAD(P)H-hydrate repair Nnr-like enzyme with NAD(P)H-hydrate dehydratase domain
MAVAGTGDVLAGLTAGFLAQGVSPLQSAINAAFLNGKAGEKAKKKYGNFSAEELLMLV